MVTLPADEFTIDPENGSGEFAAAYRLSSEKSHASHEMPLRVVAGMFLTLERYGKLNLDRC